MIFGNTDYYLLSLSHNGVRLFKGDQYGLEHVQVEGLQAGMKQALSIDEFPKWRENHAIAPQAGGKGSRASHGQYNVNQTDKIMLKEYFRRVDRLLHRYLFNKRVPLVIAGVEYLLPIYRRINSYPFLASMIVTGNMEHATIDTIHNRVWPLAKKLFIRKLV